MSRIVPTYSVTTDVEPIKSLLEEAEMHRAQAQELHVKALSALGLERSPHEVQRLFIMANAEQNAYLMCHSAAQTVILLTQEQRAKAQQQMWGALG